MTDTIVIITGPIQSIRMRSVVKFLEIERGIKEVTPNSQVVPCTWPSEPNYEGVNIKTFKPEDTERVLCKALTLTRAYGYNLNHISQPNPRIHIEVPNETKTTHPDPGIWNRMNRDLRKLLPDHMPDVYPTPPKLKRDKDLWLDHLFPDIATIYKDDGVITGHSNPGYNVDKCEVYISLFFHDDFFIRLIANMNDGSLSVDREVMGETVKDRLGYLEI